MSKTRAAACCGSLIVAMLVGGCSSAGGPREPAAAPPAASSPSGEQLYFNHCASCHGPGAEGDGPVAAVMRVNVPNLRNLAVRNGGRFPAEAVRAYVDGRTLNAAHGERLMPVWGDVFLAGAGNDAAARRRIAALVDFIAGIQYPR